MTGQIATAKRRAGLSREKTRVAVCIATYQRPEGLKRLMQGLSRLTFDKSETPDLVVVVVDNDSAGVARAVCEGISADFNWGLKCSVEPRRGIPYVRNKAVALAQEEDVNFIAFIDDDEVPEPSWLDELLHAQEVYGADVTAGPVLPHFIRPVASWMKKSKFFERRRLETGRLLTWAATNNVLVRSEVFEEMDTIFDERFALSGGSDREFFERVYDRGYKMVWADEALVHEWMPTSRLSLSWFLQRNFRFGNVDSHRELESDCSIATRTRLFAKAIKLMVRSSVRFFRGPRIVINRRRVRRYLRRIRRDLRRVRGDLSPLAEILRYSLRSVAANPRSLLKVRRSKLRSLVKIIRVRLLRVLRRVRLRPPPKGLATFRRPRIARPLQKFSKGAGMLAAVAGWRYEEYRRIHGE